MKFCLEIWGTNYEKIKDTCIFAEKNGYDGFFYGESLVNIDLDCWTILSSLINITSKIKLGPVITYLFPDYRSIALLGKKAGWNLEQVLDQRYNILYNGGILMELNILKMLTE